MEKHINIIPRDLYADELLLNLKEIKQATLIEKDAYADELLYHLQEKGALRILPDAVVPGN